MIDFQIQRGPSNLIFSEPGVVNPRLIIEEGCWYLCTDTAELFLGVEENGELTLKQINGNHAINRPTQAPDSDGDNEAGQADRGVIGAYIDEASGELYLVFSDGSEESLGPVVGKDGKDGVVTAVKIGDTSYEHANGIIELPNFATKDYVDEKVVDIDLKDYAKKTDLPDVSKFITEIPSEYVTETELNSKGYLTQHQSLDAYAKKTELTTLSNKLDIKADKILFNTNKFVNNSIGKFNFGENVNGLTIAELFAKLLGLSDTDPNETPDTPSVPETKEEIITEIMKTDTPTKVVNTDGTFVPAEYSEIEFTENTVKSDSDGSFFYTVKDNTGAIIEAGYQIKTIYRNATLTIAIPAYIKAFHVEQYDPESSDWTVPNWILVESSTQNIEGYTCYEVPASYRIRAGLTIRIVIEN